MSVRSQLSADYDKQVQENTKALMAVLVLSNSSLYKV